MEKNLEVLFPSVFYTDGTKMYECNHCNYKSTRMWCINRHALNKHGKNNNGVESNRAPVTMSIGENVEPAPTTVFGEGNQSNGAPTTQYGIQPTSHYESPHLKFILQIL